MNNSFSSFEDSDIDQIKQKYDENKKKVTFKDDDSDSDQEYLQKYQNNKDKSLNSDSINKISQDSSSEQSNKNYNDQKISSSSSSSKLNEDDNDIYKLKNNRKSYNSKKQEKYNNQDQEQSDDQDEQYLSDQKFQQMKSKINNYISQNKEEPKKPNIEKKIDLNLSKEQVEKYEQNFKKKYEFLTKNTQLKNIIDKESSKNNSFQKPDIQDIKEKYLNKQEKISNFENKIIDSQTIKQSFDEKHYQQKIEILQKQLQEKDQKNDYLNNQNLQLKTEMEKIKIQYQKLQIEISNLKQDNDDLQEKIKKNNKQKTEMEKNKKPPQNIKHNKQYQEQMQLLQTIDQIKMKLENSVLVDKPPIQKTLQRKSSYQKPNISSQNKRTNKSPNVSILRK